MASNKSVKDDLSTKNRIIDAAEEVFYRKGYYGATIREIFELAGANRGLLSYYFDSKEKLFEATIDRKFLMFRDEFHKKMEKSRPAPGEPLPLRDFCRAYIRFLLDMAHAPSGEWGNYMKFLAVANSAYDAADVSKQLERFNFIIDFSIFELKRTLPTASSDSIERAMLYLEATTSTLVATDRLWETRMHTLNQGDYHDLIEDMTAFFTSAISVHCA